MAEPTRYSLTYDFTAFQAASPTTPLPADKVEIEFNNLQTTTDEIIDNLNLIQRSDGVLANSSVIPESFSSSSLALVSGDFVPLGDWADATAYEIGDLVNDSGGTYVCHTAHTSSGSLDTSKFVSWAVTGNAGDISFTPAGSISAINVQAAIEELDADVINLNASLSGTAGTNTITATSTPTITGYQVGQIFTFVPVAVNTGAVTINIDTLGAKNIVIQGQALTGGEWKIGDSVVVKYDGTSFQMVSDSRISRPNRINLTDQGELTIVSGEITLTGSNHTVDTEGNAATDDLDTINGGVDGMFVTIRADDDARTVVVKNGTGNIYTFDGLDINLDTTNRKLVLSYDSDLSRWLVVSNPTELPVGSVYLNYSVSTNPSSLLGYGTWVAIEDMMLIGASSTYTAGSTGGAATTTVAEGNLPSNLSMTAGTGDSGVGNFFRTSATNNEGNKSFSFSSVGSGTEMDTISPYVAVYMWRRTA